MYTDSIWWLGKPFCTYQYHFQFWIVVCDLQIAPVQNQIVSSCKRNMDNMKLCTHQIVQWMYQWINALLKLNFSSGHNIACQKSCRNFVHVNPSVSGACTPYCVFKTSLKPRHLPFWKLVLLQIRKVSIPPLTQQSNANEGRLFADKCRLMPISAG